MHTRMLLLNLTRIIYMKQPGTILLVLLLIQFSLSAANVIAVLHNGLASLLLACLGTLFFHAIYSTMLSGD